MQYQFNERYEYVKTIEFVNSNPLVNVERIRYFKEEEVSGTFTKKEFRYSFDNATWANWNTLTQGNLTAINFKNRPNFWVQFKYTRDGISSGNIKRFYLFYDSNTPTPPAPTPDASIDADTLGGESPSYYLNRENFYGPFTGLNIENILGDSSTIGLYYNRIDTSIGTTFRFRGLKGQNGISVFNNNGTLIIDGSTLSLNVDQRLDIIDASIYDLNNRVLSLDSSIIRIDSSIDYLYTQIDIRDSSIQDLYEKNAIQDSSITYLNDYVIKIDSSLERIDLYQQVQDSSIHFIFNTLDLIEVSINHLYDWNLSQDASIVDLRNRIDNLDTSLYRADIDASIKEIREDVSILYYELGLVQNDISTLDSSIIRIDSSLNQIFTRINILDNSVSYLNNRVDILNSSIERIDLDISIINYDISTLRIDLSEIDSSIQKLFAYNIIQDNSILYAINKTISLDSSIERIDLDISTLQYIDFILDSSIQRIDSDISTLKYVTDSSIERIDLDISTLQYKDIVHDSSIERIDSKLDIVDSSIERIDLDISTLQYRDSVQDSSIIRIDLDISSLEYKNQVIDSSIERIDLDISSLEYKDLVHDASIERIDSDISILQYRDLVQDSSIIRIDSDISTLQYRDLVHDASIERIDANLDAIEASIALIRDDEVINIGEGSIEIYSDRDASQNILLKTIDQRGPIVITQDSSTITIDSSIVKIYDSSLSDDVYTAYKVGGIDVSTKASELKGDTYTEVLDELIFETVEPSITYPTSVFEIQSGNLFEVDENIHVRFKTTFYPGTITVGDTFQNFSTGDPSRYYFEGPAHSEIIPSRDSSYSEFVDIDLSIGKWNYTSWVTYDAGPIAYDNKGTSYGFLPDGSTINNVVTIESTYPIYANTDTIGTMTKAPLVSMIDGNDIELDFAPEVGGKNTFDIATYWIDPSFNNRPISGIQTYMDLGDYWKYQGGDSSTSLLFWDVSTTSHNVQGNIVDYTRYIYKSDNRGRIKIKIKF